MPCSHVARRGSQEGGSDGGEPAHRPRSQRSPAWQFASLRQNGWHSPWLHVASEPHSLSAWQRAMQTPSTHRLPVGQSVTVAHRAVSKQALLTQMQRGFGQAESVVQP